MGVFIGKLRNSSAVEAALKTNWAVRHLINPAIKKQYGDKEYQLKHVVGVDTSPIFACRIGVRNDNDIVWVGRAANYAAKLSSIKEPDRIFITGEVFEAMNERAKFGGEPKQLMWTERTWTGMNKMRIYSSGWARGL